MTGMGCVTLSGSTPLRLVTLIYGTLALVIRLWNRGYKSYWICE